MARAIINDEVLDCAEGTNLLAIARHHGAHVWFVCDGRGLCGTCACQVISGDDSLNAPTRLELETLSTRQRSNAYRLACQADIVGAGEVRVESLAEQLRRSAGRLVSPREGPDALAHLVREGSEFVLSFSGRLPSTVLQIPRQIVAMPPTISGIQKYLTDSQRMLWRVMSGQATAASATAPTK